MNIKRRLRDCMKILTSKSYVVYAVKSTGGVDVSYTVSSAECADIGSKITMVASFMGDGDRLVSVMSESIEVSIKDYLNSLLAKYNVAYEDVVKELEAISNTDGNRLLTQEEIDRFNTKLLAAFE